LPARGGRPSSRDRGAGGRAPCGGGANRPPRGLGIERLRHVRRGARYGSDRAERRRDGDRDADKRASCKSGARSVTFGARCPLVQWQDIGLWIREWWFESTGGNGALRAAGFW